jgi:hypothetical protein
MAVPDTSLTLTDRLAVKLYATNSGGKTTTIHTQDGHLCQIITTFSTGITALNGLTAQVQYFQTGTSGTDFNISSTTATHTFNIPDASASARGLITTGTQTIAGTKTFNDATKNNGGIFLQNASSGSLAGYMNLGGLTNGVKFTSGGGISNTFTLPSATGYTFTFPNATGTIALTSDLSSYVPYTGATTNVDLGLFSLTSNSIKVIGDNSTYGGTLSIKQSNVTSLIGVGYTELFGKTNRLGISFGAGSIALLSNSILTAERTYTLPDATGTLALTSDIPVNPITGTGTSGQVAYFNGTSSITSNATFAFTPTSQLLVNNSVTAASAIARGTNLTPTLVASANSDVLVGLDINPTFTNGAFTGVANTSLRVNGYQLFSSGGIYATSTNTTALVSELNFFVHKRLISSGMMGYKINFGGDVSFWRYNDASGDVEFGNSTVYGLQFYANNAVVSKFFANGNLFIGASPTDAGYKLDVNGTARVQDNLTVSNNRNAGTGITISNTTSGTTSASQITFTSNSNAFIGKFSSSTSAFRIINPSDLYLLNQSAGDIAIQNDVGNIKFNTTSTGNVQAILFTTGNFAVGTGTDVASAVLQASSTTKGFLPPRMTSAQRTAISSPAEGLIVVQTDGTQGLYLYIGAAWHSITML